MRICETLTCAAIAYVCAGTAHAHHGLDFLIVQTAHLPQRGTGYAVARLDHISEDHDEWEFEPAILYGATDWMTVELHGHYEKEEGESSNFESVAPALHFRLTDGEQPFSFGVSVEYEIAHASDDEDAAEAAAIFGYEATDWMASTNVIYRRHSGEAGKWGYAVGARRNFTRKHGAGIEILGSLESHGSSEFLIGYYGEFSERFTFNAGIGAGIDDGPDRSMRTGFIWRFR